MKKSTIASSLFLFLASVMLSGCIFPYRGDEGGHRGGGHYEDRHEDRHEGHHGDGDRR
jgi:hypothetical protein